MSYDLDALILSIMVSQMFKLLHTCRQIALEERMEAAKNVKKQH